MGQAIVSYASSVSPSAVQKYTIDRAQILVQEKLSLQKSSLCIPQFRSTHVHTRVISLDIATFPNISWKMHPFMIS